MAQDDEKQKRTLGLDPRTSIGVCKGCAKLKLLCICMKKDTPPASGEEQSSDDCLDSANSATNEMKTNDAPASIALTPFQGLFSPQGTKSKGMSLIEQLLNRANNMKLDPEKLLRNEGINFEQKATMEELQRLALQGDKMAMQLYIIGTENIQNRSKLASALLESAKNPLQTKNTKE